MQMSVLIMFACFLIIFGYDASDRTRSTCPRERRTNRSSVHNKEAWEASSECDRRSSLEGAAQAPPQVHQNATLVVARMESEPLEWLQFVRKLPYVLETEYLANVESLQPLYLSQKPRPRELHKPRNVDGFSTHECGGYLDFIVRHYEELPKVTIFVHGRQIARHSDPHIFQLIKQIAVEPANVGYCSLNTTRFHMARGFFGKERGEFQSLNSTRYPHLLSLFGPLLEQNFGCYSSAQFAVTRERIHRHPIAFYQELLQWMLEPNGEGGKFATTLRCLFLEYAWHIIFGAELTCERRLNLCAVVYESDYPNRVNALENKSSETVSERDRRSSHEAAAQAPPQVYQNATLVVARTETEPLEWLRFVRKLPYVLETEYPANVESMQPFHVLQKPRPRELHKPRNVDGFSTRECGGYLDFIVRHYHELPEVAIFVHGRQVDRHSDPQIFQLINHIADDPAEVGYCSLNTADWFYMTNGFPSMALKEFQSLNSTRYPHLLSLFAPFVEQEFGCYLCAQFAVTRERIHRHPIAFYQELLQWMLEPNGEGGTFATTLRCVFLEYSWHIIFGAEPTCQRRLNLCAVVYESDYLSWINAQAELVFAGFQSNQCPSGYTTIQDTTACTAAINVLGLSVGSPVSLPWYPKGCYNAGLSLNPIHAAFNTHPTGAANDNFRLICEKASVRA